MGPRRLYTSRVSAQLPSTPGHEAECTSGWLHRLEVAEQRAVSMSTALSAESQVTSSTPERVSCAKHLSLATCTHRRNSRRGGCEQQERGLKGGSGQSTGQCGFSQRRLHSLHCDWKDTLGVSPETEHALRTQILGAHAEPVEAAGGARAVR
jgi:hypothetical protein